MNSDDLINRRKVMKQPRPRPPDLIKHFKKLRIIVVGDVMLDTYVWGSVDRVSPEAPVPVLNVVEETSTLGGAANVAKNLLTLGPKVKLFGTVGKDHNGELILDIMKDQGLSTKGIVRDRDKPTVSKTRLISKNNQIARIDREDITPVSTEIEKSLFTKLQNYIKKRRPDALIISDYAKGTMSPTLTKKIIKLARSNKIFVTVDPKGMDYAKYRNADVITPNTNEAEAVVGYPIDNTRALRRASKELMDLTQCKAVLITMGKKGISLFEKGNRIKVIDSDSVDVFDVTGAGDTVVSVFTISFLASKSMEHAVSAANKAAGLVVSKVGTANLNPEDLLVRLNADNTSLEVKNYTRQSLTTAISGLKADGKTIVFTNGCFDLLHTGHIKLLNEAKQLGDVLVVAINSDSSVRKLKGSNRPYLKIEDRKRILSSLESVDYVVEFSEDTPLNLIRSLRPDIIVKGGDYTVDKVVGKDIVESYGGRVHIVELKEGVSTTKIAKRISKT